MSSLTYINEPGAGQKHRELKHYSQAVIIGNIAKLSSQGGWDSEGSLDQHNWKAQIQNAFDNIDRVLEAAGFRDCKDVRSSFTLVIAR
jgi:enamine deaminase RidA (YjgF/YER057c/UK114 family)